MVRRKLLIALAVVMSAPGKFSRAQQRKLWRVGFLSASDRPSSIEADRIGGFVRGMRDLGYLEGTNLTIEWRFAGGSNERMTDQAMELVRLNVDVIVTAGVPPTSAARNATTTIPIVMGTATDPLGSGLIKSLARPGGNITGLSNVAVDIGSKHLEMLLTVMPKLSRVAVLINPDTSSHAAILRRIQTSATAATTILSIEARTAQEIETGFAVMSKEGVKAVIVPLAPLFNQQRRQIADLAAKHHLPSVSGFNEYPSAGGLMSLGQNLTEHYYYAATYVDKILKGAMPADLPVEEPTKFEMIINRKAAVALGLTIPRSLLVRADKVIE